MEFSYKRVVIRRFFELLITNFLISLLIIIANVGEILATKAELSKGLLIGTALFLFINVRMLRNCYFDLEGKSGYYLSNAIAYLLFALLSIFLYFFTTDEIYTWLFALTKFIRYTNFQVSTFISVCTFHIIGIFLIFIAPLGMAEIINEKLECE